MSKEKYQHNYRNGQTPDMANDTNYKKPVGFYSPIAPTVPNAPFGMSPSQHAAVVPVQLEYPGERRAAAAVPLPESP